MFPIRYRRLAKEHQFKRFDLVQMTITKASDPRPESYRIDEGSIQLLKSDKLSGESKVRLWKPHVAPSLKVLLEENQNTGRSMGIIKPDPGSVKFKVKDAALNNADDQEIANMVYEQSSLLEDPLKPLIKPKYSFSYHYTCDGHPHKHQIHDWEVQATYFNYKRRYKTDKETLAKMTQEYQQNIPNQNPHFVMGTMARHRQTFILIGLLRTTVDIEAMDKQTELFQIIK